MFHVLFVFKVFLYCASRNCTNLQFGQIRCAEFITGFTHGCSKHLPIKQSIRVHHEIYWYGCSCQWGPGLFLPLKPWYTLRSPLKDPDTTYHAGGEESEAEDDIIPGRDAEEWAFQCRDVSFSTFNVARYRFTTDEKITMNHPVKIHQQGRARRNLMGKLPPIWFNGKCIEHVRCC